MVDNGNVSRTGRRVPKRGRRSHPQAKEHEGGEFLFTIAVAGQPVHSFTLTKFPDPEQVGEYDNEHREIYIKQELPSPQAEADTMLHEVFHSISSIALGPEDRLSERQVNTMALTFADTLSRNPKLKEYLFARL